MTGYIKKRPIIAAILLATFAATPATFLAQTEETATTSAPDVAVEVEMEQRFNEFQNQHPGHRVYSINRWLKASDAGDE